MIPGPPGGEMSEKVSDEIAPHHRIDRSSTGNGA